MPRAFTLMPCAYAVRGSPGRASRPQAPRRSERRVNLEEPTQSCNRYHNRELEHFHQPKNVWAVAISFVPPWSQQPSTSCQLRLAFCHQKPAFLVAHTSAGLHLPPAGRVWRCPSPCSSGLSSPSGGPAPRLACALLSRGVRAVTMLS